MINVFSKNSLMVIYLIFYTNNNIPNALIIEFEPSKLDSKDSLTRKFLWDNSLLSTSFWI